MDLIYFRDKVLRVKEIKITKLLITLAAGLLTMAGFC
jgi:hypothetical protein